MTSIYNFCLTIQFFGITPSEVEFSKIQRPKKDMVQPLNGGIKFEKTIPNSGMYTFS